METVREPKFRYELDCGDNVKRACKHGEHHMSLHHFVPRRIGSEAIGEALANDNPELAHLIKRFINHWSNKGWVGRCIHDMLDEHPEPLPDEATMAERVYGN